MYTLHLFIITLMSMYTLSVDLTSLLDAFLVLDIVSLVSLVLVLLVLVHVVLGLLSVYLVFSQFVYCVYCSRFDLDEVLLVLVLLVPYSVDFISKCSGVLLTSAMSVVFARK